MSGSAVGMMISRRGHGVHCAVRKETSNGSPRRVAAVLLIAGIIIGAVAGVVFRQEGQDDRHAAARFRIQHRGWRRRRACGFERHSDLRGTPSIVVLINRWVGASAIGSVTFSGF